MPILQLKIKTEIKSDIKWYSQVESCFRVRKPESQNCFYVKNNNDKKIKSASWHTSEL